MKLPFSTEAGFWSGDMFVDWYNEDPSEEDMQLWQFLHNWEDDIEERKLRELMDKFRTFLAKEGTL